ncbi:MAG: tetratricopeptide repeat protein [Myxococcota bacterium]
MNTQIGPRTLYSSFEPPLPSIRSVRTRPSRRRVVRVARALLVAFVLGGMSFACAEQPTLEEARSLQDAGRYGESIPVLEALVERGDPAPEVLYRYGLALSHQNLPSRAIWALTEAMQDEEWKLDAALTLARDEFRTHNHEGAIAAASVVLEIEPENEEALLLRAESRARTRNRQDYEAAVEDARLLLELNPDERRALVPLATALLALERADEAGEVLEQIATAFGTEGPSTADAPRFCLARATFAQEKSETERAETLYRECLDAFPTNTMVVQKAMEFFARQGRHDEATAIIEKAYEADPKSRDLRIGLALRQQQSGDLEGAEATLRAGTEDERPLVRAQAFQDLANFYGDHERFDEAVSTYEEAYALLEAPSPSFLFDFADLLVRANHMDRALEIASNIRVRSQSDIIVGRVYLAQGKPGEALGRFAQGLRLWPNNGVARYLAAIAAEQTGLFDRAIEEYRYAIRIDPNLGDARIRLARLLLAEGNTNLASAALHSGRSAGPDLEGILTELEILSSHHELRSIPEPFVPTIRSLGARGRAIAAVARGTWRRAGPGAALDLIASSESLDLGVAANEEALRVFVGAAIAAGRPAVAATLLAKQAGQHESNALLQGLLGRLRLAMGEADAARTAAEAALAIDASQPEALAVQAQLLEETSPEEALVLYERALSALEDPSSERREGVVLARARLLGRLDRIAEATALLETHLAHRPYDVAATRELAGLYARGGATSDPGRPARLEARADRFDAARKRAQAARANAPDAPDDAEAS